MSSSVPSNTVNMALSSPSCCRRATQLRGVATASRSPSPRKKPASSAALCSEGGKRSPLFLFFKDTGRNRTVLPFQHFLPPSLPPPPSLSLAFLSPVLTRVKSVSLRCRRISVLSRFPPSSLSLSSEGVRRWILYLFLFVYAHFPPFSPLWVRDRLNP